MAKVSVIITCYNLGNYLDEAIDSVLNQVEQDFEIIVINDGSTDPYTNRLLANYNKPKVIVYNTDNQGVSSARNFGISKATGDYICCLDADDKLHPNYLKSCVEILDNDQSNVGFVATWGQFFGNDTRIWRTLEYDPVKILVTNVVPVSAVFRKKCWEEVGGFKSVGYEDWCFWIAVVSKGWKWSIVKEVYFFYRKRDNSRLTSDDKNRYQNIKQIISYNRDYYWLRTPELISLCTSNLEWVDSYWHLKHKLSKKRSLIKRLGGVCLVLTIMLVVMIVYAIAKLS